MILPLCNKRLDDLDTPLVLRLVNPEKCETHGCDYNASDEVKDALPEIFRLRPNVTTQTVKYTDEGTTNNQAEADTEARADPDMADKAFIDFQILIRLT